MSILFNDVYDHGDSDGNILDAFKKPKTPAKPQPKKRKKKRRKEKCPDMCTQRMEELATPKLILLEATLASYHKTLEPKRVVHLVRLIHEINEPKPHRTFQLSKKKRKRKPKKTKRCKKENAERLWLKMQANKTAKLIVEYLQNRTKYVPNYKQLQVAMQLSKKLKYKKKKDVSRLTKLELDKICQQLAILCDTKFEPYKRSIKVESIKSETTISEADKKRCIFTMRDFTFESEESETEEESEEGEGEEGSEGEGEEGFEEEGEEGYGLISEIELEFESTVDEDEYETGQYDLESGEFGEGDEEGFGEGGDLDEGLELGEGEDEGEEGILFGEDGEDAASRQRMSEEEKARQSMLLYGEGEGEGEGGYLFGEGRTGDREIAEWEKAMDEIIEGLAAEGLATESEESLYGDEELLERERLEAETAKVAHPDGTASYVSWSMYSSWLNEFEKNINMYTDCLQQFGEILRNGDYSKYYESLNNILMNWGKYLGDAKRVDEKMIKYFKDKPITKCDTCADYDLTNIPKDHDIPEELLGAVETTATWKKLLGELCLICKKLVKPKLEEEEEEGFTSSETIEICDVQGSSTSSGFYVEDKD